LTPHPFTDNSFPATPNQDGKERLPAAAEPPAMLRPYVTPILQVKQETPRIKSFILRAPTIAHGASPGQFLMVWIPGVDEIPMSIAAANPNTGRIEFAAARVGDATTQLHQAKPGTLLGLRGPLGRGFTLPNDPQDGPLLLVAGGCGAAPLLFAASWASAKGWEVHVVLGAPNAHELLYRRRFRRYATNLLLATEDGSAGMKGTAVDAAALLLKGGHPHAPPTYAACLACGPEPMLQALVKLARRHRVSLQVSLERYMKCGVGICGHCIIDGWGTRICTEGPVLPANKLRGTDFGVLTRDATGRRRPLQRGENPNH